MRIHKIITLFFVTVCSFAGLAQENISYHVVIGAFANEANAVSLSKKASQQKFDAQKKFVEGRGLTYVYVLLTENKREAYALAVKLRAETEYKDAWVYVENIASNAPSILKEEPIVEIKTAEQPPIVVPPSEVNQPIDSSLLVKQTEPIVAKPSGKPFYFKLVNASDGVEVKRGEIHLQESVKAAQYQAFKIGEVVYLEAPKNKRGSYSVITQVAGYSPVNTVFNFQTPIGEKGPQGETIIELVATKAKKGDYVDFNNVKFFKNSSILQPASQNELDGLVDLLKENTKYTIRIHGHVNGSQKRECFVRGTNSAFFATNPAADKTEKNMSPKELSGLRAETVKDYLVSQGIDASRVSTKGEGATIPLYPEGGSLGPLNDRIEIEFTRN